MADHLDAPGLKPPNMDASIDICDIYAFQKPEDINNKSIFVVNVNPLAPSYADSFSPEAVYELKVDTNADALADIAYRFTFSSKKDGEQMATVHRISGEGAKGSGNGGDILFENVPVYFGDKNASTTNPSTTSAGTVKEEGEKDYRFFVGIRSDPFFFDLEGMKNNMQFTGADTFVDKNIFSIILEVPNSALGSNSKIGIWYRVLIPKDGKPFYQIDRMGRPFVNVAFTKEEDKDTFNRIDQHRTEKSLPKSLQIS
jgi:uncharacterized protein DUF4331